MKRWIHASFFSNVTFQLKHNLALWAGLSRYYYGVAFLGLGSNGTRSLRITKSAFYFIFLRSPTNVLTSCFMWWEDEELLSTPDMWTPLSSVFEYLSTWYLCGARVSIGLTWLCLCAPGSRRLVSSVGAWLLTGGLTLAFGRLGRPG